MKKKLEATNDIYIQELLKDERYRFFPDGRIETLITKQGHLGKEWRDCITLDHQMCGKTYRQISYTPSSRSRIKIKANRIIWAMFNTQGENGTRMELDPLKVIRHLNDNSLQDNIENLALGTVSENNYDSYKNGRSISYGNAKIDFDIADQIRLDRASQQLTYDELQEKYKLAKGSISEIINNKIWVRKQ